MTKHLIPVRKVNTFAVTQVNVGVEESQSFAQQSDAWTLRMIELAGHQRAHPHPSSVGAADLNLSDEANLFHEGSWHRHEIGGGSRGRGSDDVNRAIDRSQKSLMRDPGLRQLLAMLRAIYVFRQALDVVQMINKIVGNLPYAVRGHHESTHGQGFVERVNDLGVQVT